MEIEELWKLMMKQSKWRRWTTTGRVINQKFNSINKEIKMKQKTTIDCEGIVSGAMQHKMWRPGEQQQTIATTKDRLQKKVWDPGGQRLEAHDQEIMIIFYFGSLMQEHLAHKFIIF